MTTVAAAISAVYTLGWFSATVTIRHCNKTFKKKNPPPHLAWVAAAICGLLWPIVYIISRVCEQLTPED